MRIEVRRAPWTEDPFPLYRAFYRADGISASPGVFLESARPGPATGRYSILARDPFLALRYENGVLFLEEPRTGKKERRTEPPFVLLKRLLARYAAPDAKGLPPFATGAVGYVGYECKDLFAPARPSAGSAKKDAKSRVLPDLYFLFFDRCFVWDHTAREFFLCAHSRALLRKLELELKGALRRAGARSAARAYSPQRPMRLECSFGKKRFEEAVLATKDYIRKGDIFQANLAQRFSFDMKKDPFQIYERLRQINPSPFFGVLDGKDFQIISGSPERLLKLRGRQLETRPIAGTRWRGRNIREDRRLELELLLSDKERAEHIMLVDLERNDLGRVAEYGSVTVDELMAVEDYSHVKHIVSNVRATLRAGLGATDAFSAFFPGGTITGAPKVRCMQIIDELEPVARGPYTGSLGYFSFTGNMDFNILIRSLAVRAGRAYLHAGAGIVADSDPGKEYDETLHKAEAVLSAVFGQKQVRSFFRRSGAGARIPR